MLVHTVEPLMPKYQPVHHKKLPRQSRVAHNQSSHRKFASYTVANTSTSQNPTTSKPHTKPKYSRA